MKNARSRAAHAPRWLALLSTACLAAHAAPPPQANDNLTEILVLSNRADLVSGGDALVEIRLPAKAKARPQDVKVDVDGVDVTAAFAVRADGRFLGLVTGLAEGVNRLRARVPNGPGASLLITNHRIGGPVFSGEQVQPWTCQTQSTNATNDLGPALDAQCNAPTKYRYMYRTTTGQFVAYDPAAPTPANMATATTDQGVTVPYIVRVERGTANRGIHEIAVLFNPAQPWTAWARQPQWNGKVVVQFGAGTSQTYRQGNNESVLNNEALSLGYMVFNSSMMVNSQHANFVTAAETAMMLKERIVEQYGEIRYAVGQGNSGGALLQHLTADAYPGILDGLRPSQDWTDSISGAYREFADSAAVTNAFNTSGVVFTPQERAAIGGWGLANINVFNIENGRVGDYNRPDDGTACAGAASQDPVSNPFGTRCTFQDFMVGILGRRPEDGFANLVYDNVGVQYGLAAVNAGTLSPEKFVAVNAKAGGFDVNGRWQPERSAISAEVAAMLHRTGQVTFGRNMGQIPELAIRGTNNNDYHYPFRTYVQRARLTAQNGDADTHVFWTAPPSSQSTLKAMDRWITAIQADTRDIPQGDKVALNKPVDVVIACWIGGVMVTDQSQCDTTYPYFREPRTVAGDAPTTYVMKCQLKALDPADYTVAFTPDQWAQLQATFPAGVCDFSKPGVGFQPTVSWLTYAAGPGGQPLPAAPASKPGDGQ